MWSVIFEPKKLWDKVCVEVFVNARKAIFLINKAINCTTFIIYVRQFSYRLECHLRGHLLRHLGGRHHLLRRVHHVQEEEENPAEETLYQTRTKRTEHGDEA
jgi:hypothetical protein